MAASRVNTKFVAILVGGLATVTVGGGGVLYYFVANNATRLAAMAERAGTEGDFEKAERLYSKAVNKEQANADLLRKWIAAIQKVTPETENSYRVKYGEYFAANVALATKALQTDVEAHRAALELAHREIKDRMGDPTGNSGMVANVDNALKYFERAKDNKHDVLRKYSGLALLRSYEAAANLKDSEIERSRTDLEKAIAADPADGEAVTGLARWHDRTAFVLAQKNDTEASKTERDKARKILADFVAAHPDDTHGALWDLLAFITNEEVRVASGKDLAEREALAVEGSKSINERLDGFAAVLGKVDPARLDVMMVDRLMSMELRFSPTGPRRAEALYDRMLAAAPADTRLMLSKAALLGEARREAEAIDLLQKLVDTPQKPVSFEGVMQYGHRARARYLQSLYAVRRWEAEKNAQEVALRKIADDKTAALNTAGDDAARAAVEKDAAGKKAAAEQAGGALMKGWLDKARTYRAALASLTEADSPELLFIDAHLSIAEENFGAAMKKLVEYNRKTKDADTQALWMTAQCALRQNPPLHGVAEANLKMVVDREKNNLRANLALAKLYIATLKRESEAAPYIGNILLIDSKNEEGLRYKEILEAKAGMDPSKGGKLDAVSRGLLDCDRLENEGKAAEAYDLLKRLAKDAPDDVRVIPPLVARMAKRGETPAAKELVDAALRTHPDDGRLLQAKIVLETDDPLEQRVRIIDLYPGQKPLDRLVAKVQVYRLFANQYQKSPNEADKNKATPIMALANKALDEAIALDPENGAVIEMQFLRALTDKDYTTAERLSEKAKQRDLDGVEGATFRARLLAERGRRQDGIRELVAASQKDSFGPNAGRILADLMVQERMVTEAIKVLEQALAKRPTDRDCTLFLAGLYDGMYRGTDALALLRNSQQLHAGDADVQNRWLELEADYGNKDVALTQRIRQLDIDPNNQGAKAAVARLLIQKREFVGARKYIDELKAAAVPEAVVLEASWCSEQGNMAGAKKVFDDAIAAIPEGKRTSALYLAKGAFLEQVDHTEEAAAVYKEAARYQDPKVLEADRALSSLLFRQGAVRDAVALFRKIVEANADDDKRNVTRNLIDALLRLEDGAEASKVLDSLGAVVADDCRFLLQRAEAVRLGGDEKKALEFIDQAIQKFQHDPLPYYRRAMLNSRYPELKKDVKADLLKAIEERPAFWQARRDLARILAGEDDLAGAIGQMRDAVKFNTDIDDLRVQLVRDLLSPRFKGARDADASEVIESVIERRRGDVGLLLNSGDLMREAGRNEAALGYYRRAYEISQQMAVVTRYIDLLQATNPPNLAEVDRVLVALKAIQDTEPALLMARAKQYIFRNKVKEGITDMVASLRLIRPDQPGLIMAWFGDIKRMLAKQKDVTDILEIVDKEKLVPGWTTYFRAGTMMEVPDTQAEAVRMLEDLVKTCEDQVLLRQAYIALQARYYQTNDCENSIRILEASLVKFPDDAFILNNYAYMLVRCGQDPAKAVPIAEHAVKSMNAMNRTSADVLDTMGWVYVKAGMPDKAAGPLMKALAEAGNGPIRATVLMHIAEFYMARKDKKAALDYADQAKKCIDAFPKSAAATGQDKAYDALKKAVDEMK